MKPEMLKPLEENIGVRLQITGVGKDSLNRTLVGSSGQSIDGTSSNKKTSA